MATQIKDMPENNKHAREAKESWLERAKVAGLDGEATRAEVTAAETAAKDPNAAPAAPESKIKHMNVLKSDGLVDEKLNNERNAWIDRAKAVGLDGRATCAEVEAAEGEK